MLKIATWNVNSARLRLPHIVQWLQNNQPDILCLQEIKCQTDEFPRLEIEALGYKCYVRGQKGFNGVAILSRVPVELLNETLHGDPADEQSRFMEVQCDDFHVINIYLPNGNPVDTEKYPYKLAWLDRLIAHCQDLIDRDIRFLVCGDFNILPEDIDSYNPAVWANDALFKIETRQKWRQMLNMGLVDAFRIHNKSAEQYSFWDYQGGAWQNNLGIRIDHFLLSPHLTDRLVSCQIDKSTRALEKPSDHVPVFVELNLK